MIHCLTTPDSKFLFQSLWEDIGLTYIFTICFWPCICRVLGSCSCRIELSFQSILPSIDSFVKSSDGPIGRVLSECLQDDTSFSNCLSGVGKLQFQLSKRQARVNSENLLFSAATVGDAARMRSVQGKSVGACMVVCLTNRSRVHTLYLRFSFGDSYLFGDVHSSA